MVKDYRTDIYGKGFGAYGIRTAQKGQALRIDFQREERPDFARTYSYLIDVNEGQRGELEVLELVFPAEKTIVSGRNLHVIYEWLLIDKITFMQENVEETMLNPDSKRMPAFIEAIERE